MQRLYEEWARGDFSRTDIFDPEVESRGFGMLEGDQVETRGLQQLGPQMMGWLRTWERPFVIEGERFVEAGDRIAVLIRWRGRGKESGTPVESQGAHLWKFRDGRAVRFDVYRDREQALAALREASGQGDR